MNNDHLFNMLNLIFKLLDFKGFWFFLKETNSLFSTGLEFYNLSLFA